MSLVPGNTPLVSLDRLISCPGTTLWAKLESHNPSGSAKDRTAHAILAAADLQPGAVIVESSSGNLGVAMAREAVLGGWTFHCVVDPKANRSTIATMRAFGAVVHEITEPDPETGDWLAARRARVAELLAELPGASASTSTPTGRRSPRTMTARCARSSSNSATPPTTCSWQ